MQQFDLDTWLKNKSRKIVTRDGRPVRIVCWDVKSISPIIGIIQDRLGGEFARNYALNGRYSPQNETEYDLFFVDEEDELTEFNDECYDFTFELIQNNKKQLGLDDECIGVPLVIHNLCMISYQYGYNKAKEETK